ncbi:MAG: cation diffusion facilitator family transporter [Gemmatimonadetes bacterium]|nr:cation diffusion facilitator family transporter [Gemmatimonadota bacterium]
MNEYDAARVSPLNTSTSFDPVVRSSIRAAQTGAAANILLAAAKITAGIFGNTYALVADGVESLADVVSSLIVWGGIAVGARPADEDHPFGHGKAEALAAAAVSLMLLAAGVGIGVQAIKEIRTPHAFPAAWTLGVLLAVVAIKSVLARRVSDVGRTSGSAAVEADAMHHLSDALTSGAAFIGISAALMGRHFGGGESWAAADDWAALFASVIIAWNGVMMFFVGLHDLMDRSPGEQVLAPLREAALSVEGVRAIEKLAARRVGNAYRVTVHVQASPEISLAEGHVLGGRVKRAMCAAGTRVQSVLVHMEPYDE